MNLKERIFESYIDAQRGLTEVEQYDENNVVLSLPLHFSAHTRVELAVTRLTDTYFAISDMAQTLGELKDAGYGVSQSLKDKIELLAKSAGLKFAGNHLIRECTGKELGSAIQEFAEAAKTIGDAYLTYRMRRPKEAEDELVAQVRRVFIEKKYQYAEKQEVPGEIEKHTVDFYIPPNGTRGLALAVLPNPTQIIAEAWGFKTQDIKNVHRNVTVSIVYDSYRAKEVSRNILDKMADVPVPSNVIGDLSQILTKAGVGRTK
jgi:hypothetical protein